MSAGVSFMSDRTSSKKWYSENSRFTISFFNSSNLKTTSCYGGCVESRNEGYQQIVDTLHGI